MEISKTGVFNDPGLSTPPPPPEKPIPGEIYVDAADIEVESLVGLSLVEEPVNCGLSNLPHFPFSKVDPPPRTENVVSSTAKNLLLEMENQSVESLQLSRGSLLEEDSHNDSAQIKEKEWHDGCSYESSPRWWEELPPTPRPEHVKTLSHLTAETIALTAEVVEP